MKAILSLVNKYFWKGIIGPVFAFLIPTLLVLFMGRILGPTTLIPGLFLISPLCILLVFMPQSVFEFRNSSLLKRIGTTPIKPWKFLAGISLFNFIITIASFVFILAICFLVFIDFETKTSMFGSVTYIAQMSYIDILKQADWVSFLYFFFLIILISILIGLFIASIGKSTLFVQCTGIGILLITLFVGPAVLPVAFVGSTDIVKWLGYLLPLKYPFTGAIESFTSGTQQWVANWSGSSPWDINTDFIVLDVFKLLKMNVTDIVSGKIDDLITPIANKSEKILNHVLPWLFILGFSYLVAATFKWSNRGKSSFRWRVITEIVHYFRQKTQNINSIQNNVNSQYILEVEHLTKKFKTKDGELVANDDLTFKVKKGHNLAIIGHNGAGKSVLVETIVGVNPVQSGQIKYNFNYNKSFNEKIGIQFQDSSYPFGISVKDILNFFIAANNIKISKNEFENLINKFGVKSYLNKNASSLSGGQQQRINLLLAVIHKPKLIVLDELSTGLDIKIRNEIKVFIKEYAKQEEISIIVVSHDMNEVEYLADDILILQNGQIKEFTSKATLLKKYKNLENYVYKYL